MSWPDGIPAPDLIWPEATRPDPASMHELAMSMRDLPEYRQFADWLPFPPSTIPSRQKCVLFLLYLHLRAGIELTFEHF